MYNYGENLVEYQGKTVKINDIPDRSIRAGAGIGHFYHSSRGVVEVTGVKWEYIPEYCPTDNYQFKWLFNNTVLVCMGCGLDGT